MDLAPGSSPGAVRGSNKSLRARESRDTGAHETASVPPNKEFPMKSRSRRGLGLILAGVVALIAGGAMVYAHGGKGGHGRMDVDEMAEHFQVHVKHVLAEVDAT